MTHTPAHIVVIQRGLKFLIEESHNADSPVMV